MTQADKIDPHIFHQQHFLTDLIFRHRCSYSGMIFMAVSSSEQESFAIEHKGAFFYKFKVSETHFFRVDRLFPFSIHRYFQGIQVWIFRRP
ncbi:hypothetical protein D3C85_1208220 [compost metagenome]